MHPSIQKAEEKGLSLNLIVEPMENKELSYWYGGEVARVSRGNESLVLEANGDVRCYYRTLNEDGSESETFVKDKRNQANFYHELDADIPSDEALNESIQNYENDKFPQLEIQDNNWWEVFVIKDGEWHDIMCVVDADTYSEALNLLIDQFDEYIGTIE